MNNRKIEINCPCLKDIIFLSNFLAQSTQTVKVNCNGRKWDVGKNFRGLSTRFRKEEFWDYCLIIDS